MATNRNNLEPSDKMFIEENHGKLSPTKIAKRLNKSENIIIDYITNIMKVEVFDDAEFEGSALRSKPEWELLKEQFTPDELKLFEHSYTRMVEQFQEDVLATEEKQIFQAIELEIFMHRNKKARKLAAENIARIEREIKEETESDPEDYDRDRVDSLRRDLAGYLASQGTTAKEYNEYSAKHTTIMRELKGTREQRIKQLADAKINFMGLLKQLEDDEYRKRQAIQNELVKKALDKEKERLYNLHTFKDGTVSSPLINSESVKQNEI